MAQSFFGVHLLGGKMLIAIIITAVQTIASFGPLKNIGDTNVARVSNLTQYFNLTANAIVRKEQSLSDVTLTM